MPPRFAFRKRPSAATFRLLVEGTGLAFFGVAFEAAFRALEAAVPHAIYDAPSYTLALLEQRPAFLLAALLALVLAAWSATPGGRRRLAWSEHDGIGGMRWVVLGTMVALAWPYAAYPYNHYYDQAHLWDRGLVLLFMLLTLRSPAWIFFFALQVVISRVQTHHPVSSIHRIPDELPFRVLGAVAGFALWNLLAAWLRSRRDGGRPAWLRPLSAPIGTHTLVFAVLCLLGSYYVYAAVGKLELGAQPLDWVRHNHLENLFVAAHLNGWNGSLSEARVLELAHLIRPLSVPISAATLALELGMGLLLARRWLTVLLLVAAIGMHLSIVAMTGVFFWTWALVDGCVAAWLIRHRRAAELDRIYTPARALLSVLVIAALVIVAGQNRFAWWNTKWTTFLELQAVDREGEVRVIDYSDFSPYVLVTFWKPYGPSTPGLYGATMRQDVALQLESAEPEALEAQADARWIARRGPQTRGGALDEFVQRYFRNRNRNLGRNILALPPPPTLRMRSPREGIPYRGEAPVERVRVRFVEVFYTGSSLYPLRDTIVHTISIPPSG